MKIGNVEIRERLFLAPMCNITLLPFRVLCKKYGAGLVYTEMINAEAYLRASIKTEKRALFDEGERPIGVQIFGSEGDALARAAKKIEAEIRPDIIDINVGCPAYNVMKTGSGASLLDEPEKLSELVYSISSAISIPLTCKMRITSSDEKTICLARTVQKSGAKALTVHGRTAGQGYTGKANWAIIKKIKEALSIPVILNGDVRDELSAEKAFSETNCDAVMIGRAAIGNPTIFRRILHYLKTGEMLPRQTFKETVEIFSEYLVYCERYGSTEFPIIKIQALNFCKGYTGGRQLREKISIAKNANEIKGILQEFASKPYPQSSGDISL